jgi:class 3 adenylate cyclase
MSLEAWPGIWYVGLVAVGLLTAVIVLGRWLLPRKRPEALRCTSKWRYDKTANYTVVCCDYVQFTATTGKADDVGRGASLLLKNRIWQCFDEAWQQTVNQRGSGPMAEVDRAGDGVLLIFANANDAFRYVKFLHEKAREWDEEQTPSRTSRRDSGRRFFRSGVSTGKIDLDDRVGPAGSGVIQPNRLCSAARPGECVIDVGAHGALMESGPNNDLYEAFRRRQMELTPPDKNGVEHEVYRVQMKNYATDPDFQIAVDGDPKPRSRRRRLVPVALCVLVVPAALVGLLISTGWNFFSDFFKNGTDSGVFVGGAGRNETPPPEPRDKGTNPGKLDVKKPGGDPAGGDGWVERLKIVVVETEAGLKLTGWQSDSPVTRARCGGKPWALVQGDVIAAVNGTWVQRRDLFLKQIANSGPNLRLSVLDANRQELLEIEIMLE